MGSSYSLWSLKIFLQTLETTITDHIHWAYPALLEWLTWKMELGNVWALPLVVWPWQDQFFHRTSVFPEMGQMVLSLGCLGFLMMEKQCGTVVRSACFEVRQPQEWISAFHLLAVWFWENNLTSLSCSFLNYRMRVIVVSTSESFF